MSAPHTKRYVDQAGGGWIWAQRTHKYVWIHTGRLGQSGGRLGQSSNADSHDIGVPLDPGEARELALWILDQTAAQDD